MPAGEGVSKKLGNRDIEAARTYHATTKHSYTSVRTDAHFLDWDNRPMPYKLYPEVSGLALPRDLSLARGPALGAIASDAPGDGGDLSLEALTRILFCSDGLTRRTSVGGQDYHFRAAPSAGALYPIEIYTAVAEIGELEQGLYHFSPADLRLRGLRRGDWRELIGRAAAGRPSLLQARAVLVLSAIFWRSAWKYRARAYRYCFWDAGTMLANLLAAAAAGGLSTELVTAFADPEIEALLGIDGEREGALCLVALGSGAAPPGPAPELRPLGLETIPLSREEVSYPDLVRMHQASRLLDPEVAAVADARVDSLPLPLLSANAVRPGPLDAGVGLSLGETILKRGSTRVFAHKPITAEELATIMAASSRHPRADFAPLSDTYLIVNAAHGMEPGAYYYRRRSGEFELLKPGTFRREAGYLCLEQPLGADCSALVCYMADLERLLDTLGNRAYRDAHLEAGLHGGRAYLAAYALGRGATGLTFYDDETANFFAPHAAGKSPLLMVAIGVPRSSDDET
ncbi:MAG: SagB/ThcOx family dehydrogenase [Candidatus Binataceae bacterium]